MNPLKIRQIRSQHRKQHIFFLVAKLLLLLVGFFRSKMKLHEAGNPFRSRFSQDIYHWQWWVRVKGPKMDSLKKMTFAKVEMYETYVKHLWNICHIELMNPPNRCPFFEDIFGPPPKKIGFVWVILCGLVNSPMQLVLQKWTKNDFNFWKNPEI